MIGLLLDGKYGLQLNKIKLNEFKSRYGESELLSILDGENQISGVCNIATTNYPELLDKRIVGRPCRFDRVHRIKKRLPKGAPIEEWVRRTDGLSIASISETIISVFCFGKTLDEAVRIGNPLPPLGATI